VSADVIPILELRLNRRLRVDLSTAQARADAALDCVDLIATHPNPIVRDEYVVALARVVGIDVDYAREVLARRVLHDEDPF
jgi:hypothetical protein